MGPLQQWRASERVDNRATDPCSELASFLSAFFQRGYLLGEAQPISLYQLGSIPARQCQSPRYKSLCMA